MKNILFVPIDNRPVTYSLNEQIAAIYEDIKLSLPNRELLGGLKKISSRNEILNWLKNGNFKKNDFIILSLDTIAYGGLVPSRRGSETIEEIKFYLEELKNILKTKKEQNPLLKIYASSSIMRISNNNENEEEKEYWAQYGRKIFSYSYNFHKNNETKNREIPEEILKDYMDTRKRNFEINKIYLDWLKDNILDFLVFSKDDTGEYGLNVLEAEFLEKKIKAEKLNAIVKTGADEIPFLLFTRAISEGFSFKIKIVYSNPASINKISKYEDISVEKSLLAQIALGVSNYSIVSDNPDFIFYINNFEKTQGDFIFQDVINKYDKNFPDFSLPFIAADINNANGADNVFVEKMLDKKRENLLAYAGWNTTSNTIGSALGFGIIKFIALENNKFNKNAFKNCLITRLLDDWAYQANLRSLNKIDIEAFRGFEEKIKNFTGNDFAVEYSLPWNRSFEIEIRLR